MNASGRPPHYRRYPSSEDPSLELYANFIPGPEPRPLLLTLHGWHGSARGRHTDDVRPPVDGDWFMVEPDMRGRGESTGHPDANGWELNDAVDAVEFARHAYGELILHPELIQVYGGSGGGANVLGLMGKFPDRFCAAVCECGISDFGSWFDNDHAGEFRDELEGKGWIGGTPQTRPEAYASRGGLTTASNLLTPLALTHGASDPRCPVDQTRRYVERARSLGKENLVRYLELEGVGSAERHWAGITPEQDAARSDFVRAHFRRHRSVVKLPRRGSLVVAGYVKTRAFEVLLDSVDRIGTVTFDLDAQDFRIYSDTARHAVLRIRDEEGWTESARTCRPEIHA